MKYELQFTVKTDAVKQNRKLPEIAFFDTDGNPISFGGGGSVDVSGLLPRDGSRAMTGPLDLGGPSLVFDDSSWYGPDYPVLGILGLEDSELDILESSVVVVSADGNHYSGFSKHGFFTDVESADSIPFGVQIGGGWHRFIINGDGILHWGDGTAAPDVSLKRIAPGHLNIPGVDSGLIVGDPSGVYFGAYGNAYTEGYAAAADNWIHTVQVAGETGTRGVWRADGQLLWGDGTADPDASLSRIGGYGPDLGFMAFDGAGLQLHSLAYPGPGPSYNEPMIQFQNDTGYGGYIWVQNDVGHGDMNALYFNVGGEDYTFLMQLDGTMHWGDGTAAPDISLRRITDIDDVGLSLDGNLFFGLNADYSVAGMEMGDWGIYAQNNDGTQNFSLSSGGLNFNGGALSITRDSSYGLGLKIPGDSVARIFIDPHGPIGWSEGSSVDTFLQRAAAGVLENPVHGGGFKLWNDDGTVSKTVRLNHAGDALELV